MKRLGVVVVLACLFGASSAGATTIQTSDTSHPWQQLTGAAQVPTWAGTLPLTVASDYFACGGFTDADGCTSITGNVDGPPTVSTEVNGGADAWTARGTLYHELGQVFWAEYMTASDEDQFMRLVGLPGDHTNWTDWGGAYARTVNGWTYSFSPFEWFAEGYRLCATWGVNQPLGANDFIGLGYPGLETSFAAQQRQVCQLIDQVGLDNGIATPAQATYPGPVARTKRPVAKPARRDRRIVGWGRRRIW